MGARVDADADPWGPVMALRRNRWILYGTAYAVSALILAALIVNVGVRGNRLPWDERWASALYTMALAATLVALPLVFRYLRAQRDRLRRG